MKKTKLRILITGGCGFIGSNLIKYFFNKYHDLEIVNVDKLTYAGSLENVKEVERNPDYSFVHMDIADENLMEVFKYYKPQVVISLAAESHVDASIRNPRAFVDTDIVGTFNLAYCSLKQGVERIVAIGTDEEYGPIEKGEVKESAALNPTSPYAASKAAATMLLMSYYKTYGLPLIVIRPSNNYGPNQYPEKLIPCSIYRLLKNKKVILHGRGKEIREWIYVYDCCKAIDGIMRHGRVGEIYNVGSGQRINNLIVVKSIIEQLYGSLKDYHTLITLTENRPGNDSRYSIDSTKTKLIIGEYVSVSFLQGLRITIDWYRRNQKWLEKTGVDLDSNIYVSNEDYLR